MPVPMRVARGPLRLPLLSMPGPKILCGVSAGTGAFLTSADMDLGVFLESPQWSQSLSRVRHARALSSRAVAAVSRLPSRGSRDQGLSLEAFPRGFPTRLSTGMSHVPPWCESILGLKVEALQGKQVSLEWTETSGDSGNVARPWSSSRLSCGECLLLRCDGNAGNSFPTTQGKDPSSRARSRKRGCPGCGRDSRASSGVETGMSGKFLSCSKCVKDHLEVPEVRSF